MFKLATATASLSLIALVRGDAPVIAGYLPLSDVTSYALIDLDVNAMTNNFTTAYQSYSVGGNSIKSDGSIRTIKGFSTVVANLKGPWYDVYKTYWSDPMYADTFTTSACLGTGDFAPSTTPPIGIGARTEGCKKGAVAMNIWMYVIREMEIGIDDCNAKNIGTPSNWDEAVAFYAGSLTGPRAASIGVSVHSFAEKRCLEFGTCDGSIAEGGGVDYDASVSKKIFDLFELGQSYQISNRCGDLSLVKENIVKLMVIPLLQGVIKYLYLVKSVGTENQRAELWTFAAAILPYINKFSPSVADLLKKNSLLKNTEFVPDGHEAVIKALQSIYPSLGFSCADIGGFTSTTSNTGFYPGTEPCNDATTSGRKSGDSKASTPPYGIALAVIFSLIGCCCITGAVYFFYIKPNSNSGSRLNEYGSSAKV